MPYRQPKTGQGLSPKLKPKVYPHSRGDKQKLATQQHLLKTVAGGKGKASGATGAKRAAAKELLKNPSEGKPRPMSGKEYTRIRKGKGVKRLRTHEKGR